MSKTAPLSSRPRPLTQTAPTASKPKAAAQAAPKHHATTQHATTQQAWGPSGAAALAGAKQPFGYVCSGAKAFVDSYAAGEKATTQAGMVASSVKTNAAADGLLKGVAQELQSQLEGAGKDGEAAKLGDELAAFFKDIGPAKPYYVDPDRGSMAALEDNGDRQQKVMAKLAELTGLLEQANDEPVGDSQAEMTQNATGMMIASEARFALKFDEAYAKGGSAVIKKAEKFLTALPKRIAQDPDVKSSQGGSMQPMLVAGTASSALQDFATKTF